MYDLIIIGGGPAGVAAAVYAARKRIKTLLITEEIGGQSTVSETIYNWIGTPEIAGTDLTKSFEQHLNYYADDDIFTLKLHIRVSAILQKEDKTFSVTTEQGECYDSKTVLVASGSARRKLPVTGAERLEHKGLTYCATCDGPLFSGMDVVVVGGGNAGFESASQLSAYCKSVTILQRSPEYRAEQITVEKILAKDNVVGITNTNITEVTGENFVDGIIYTNKTTGEEKKLSVQGIFVEIGQIPNSTIVKDLVKLDESNHIMIDPWTQRTSTLGVWAAGDVSNVRYHQNNISAGDAIKALENIYQYLQTEY